MKSEKVRVQIDLQKSDLDFCLRAAKFSSRTRKSMLEFIIVSFVRERKKGGLM